MFSVVFEESPIRDLESVGRSTRFERGVLRAMSGAPLDQVASGPMTGVALSGFEL
jgi:hypothetical protein